MLRRRASVNVYAAGTLAGEHDDDADSGDAVREVQPFAAGAAWTVAQPETALGTIRATRII